MSDHDVLHDRPAARFGTAWLRFCASVVDGVIFAPLIALLHFLGPHIHSPALMLALWLAYSACAIAYRLLLHGFRGQTIGKMLLKVKVLDLSETPLSMRQALVRDSPWILILLIQLPWIAAFAMAGGNILQWDVEPPMPLVVMYLPVAFGLLTAVALLLSSKRRALHDLLAGSVVVRTSVP